MIEKCRRCDGHGNEPQDSTDNCVRCKGVGAVDPKDAMAYVNERKLKRLLWFMNHAESLAEATEMLGLIEALEKELGQ